MELGVSKINTIGVVGAGVIGVGVAQIFAEGGYRVVLLDKTDEILESARKRILRNIRCQRFFRRDVSSFDPDAVLSNILFTSQIDDLRIVDYLIENVTEDWSIKEQIYLDLDRICPPDIIFAANTSTFPIEEIAKATARPDKVVGLHFMNPVSLKKSVEAVVAPQTSKETLNLSLSLLSSIGKDPIVVGDGPGFVANRILMLAINEAIWVLRDGQAAVEDVDKIFRSCFGHKMGPLETADLIGLDTILYSLKSLYQRSGADKYKPCPLLMEMVEAGVCGSKSGQGFYSHEV